MDDPGFVDKRRPVQRTYYDLMDRAEQEEINYRKAVKLLKRLIEEDPDFLDPYLQLYELFLDEGNPQKARRILDEAFERAVGLVTDQNGHWPSRLRWGFLENRHIIRTILNKAISEWDDGNLDQALELLRKLLTTNPDDNVGARHFILAIRMGFTFAGFEDRFNKGGYYDKELTRWFEEHAQTFPGEFGWWFEEMDEWGL